MIVPTVDRRLAAGIVGSVTLLVIGWTGLLVPSLIRVIKEAFHQSDAGIGVAYLAYALAYAGGSVLGGQLMERVGRRSILAGAAVLHGVGIAGLGLAPSWSLFVAAMLPAGLGAGCLDGGSNGLVLDVYREGRGRAMNLLHVSFGVGALLAPLVVGRAVEAGVTWETIMLLHPCHSPDWRSRTRSSRCRAGGDVPMSRPRQRELPRATCSQDPCSFSGSPSRAMSRPRSVFRTGSSGSWSPHPSRRRRLLYP